MLVRILSGNLKGQIVEQTPGEAEMNIATGFAELISDPPVEPEGQPEMLRREPAVQHVRPSRVELPKTKAKGR